MPTVGPQGVSRTSQPRRRRRVTIVNKPLNFPTSQACAGVSESPEPTLLIMMQPHCAPIAHQRAFLRLMSASAPRRTSQSANLQARGAVGRDGFWQFLCCAELWRRARPDAVTGSAVLVCRLSGTFNDQ